MNKDQKNQITITDIAKLSGVSKSTVSRYLNDGYVSEKKANVIRQIIKETGFKTNFYAKKLKSNSSKLIGVIVPRLDSYAAGKILTGLNFVLEKKEYQVLILVSDLSIKKEIAHINRLINQGVDGIVVQSAGITKEHLEIENNSNIPIIYNGQSHQRLKYISFDDKKAGQLMGNYIKNINHKNVVYLGVSKKDKAVGQNRFEGFKNEFLKDNPCGKIHFVKGDFSFDMAYEKGEEVIGYNPTAIVCATDNMALGILRFLHQKQIKIPSEISVVGFGGYNICDITSPSLTSIFYDYVYLGAKTAIELINLLEKGEFKSKLLADFSLITKESSDLNKGEEYVLS